MATIHRHDGTEQRVQLSRCRGSKCEQRVLWAKTQEGKRIPLSFSSPVYVVIGQDEEGTPIVRRAQSCFVQHHATCKSVEEFQR